jgi:hypothetical protein
MTIREQAEYHRLLLAMGIHRREDVIAWADQLITQGGAPIQVINLSLAAQAKDYELDSLLAIIPGDGDLALAAHAALRRFKMLLPDLSLEDAVKQLVTYGNTARVPESEHHVATFFRVRYDHIGVGHAESENELWELIGVFLCRHAEEPATS